MPGLASAWVAALMSAAALLQGEPAQTPAAPPFGMSEPAPVAPPPATLRPSLLSAAPASGPRRVVRGERAPDGPFVDGQVLETRPRYPAAAKAPAFPQQTRARYRKTRFPYVETVVASGLKRPWGMAFLPDGHILLSLKTGALRVATRDGGVGPPLAGVPDALQGGDAGLLDVVADPAIATNHKIYFSYVEKRPDGNGLTVAVATLSSDETRLEDVRTLITAPSFWNNIHYGGRLFIGADGKLYIGSGERGLPQTRVFAQSLNSRWGKILRINLDGSIPTDNPFVSLEGGEPAIWSLGNRIVQGFATDPVTGELWSSEFGEQGGDEINVIRPGHNYGWPIASYGAEYTDLPTNRAISQWPGTDQPIYYWDPTIAPSGIAFYSGALMPGWRNNLFVAALAGQHLDRLVIRDGKVVGEERLLMDQHQRIRDVAQGPDGALWVLTDAADGRLIRVAPPGR